VKAAVVVRPHPGVARLADLWEMTKPGITFMVVLTAGMGYLLAEGRFFSLGLLIHTLLGTGFVSAGASVLNQVLERRYDALMRRTENRPLPAGRLDPDLALVFGVALSLVGLVELTFAVNLLTAALGVIALAGYVFAYTPLKRYTELSTVVGGIPGAIPPMMGWAAVRNDLDLAAWVLFGILFFWQMPHFLAIAWLCREDYARGGFPMLTVIDPSGKRAARQSVLYAAALVPLSLLPSILGLTGAVYFGGALLLGLGYLAASFGFARALAGGGADRGARRLMFTSILYFPALLAVMILDRWVA
jgi:protoheme IX farnesyltransferase